MMELSTSSATEPNDGKADEQTSASPPATKRIKIETLADIDDNKISNKKPKDSEICVPIVYGSAAFWLGKKASEYLSHKWTVYVRGAKNEDLGVVIKRVVFQLHHSFKNPYRVVESPPFELSESGWGEFEIAITVFFHDDVCDRKLDLAHLLKLYPPEDGPLSTKKPVVTETYDEIVFPNPSESFYSRVCSHPAVILSRFPPPLDLLPVSHDDENPKKRGDTKYHSLSQWFTEFSDADELLHLTAAREQVQSYIAKLKKQLGAAAAPPQPSENSL